ncbi:hypothetical protein L3Y34_010418 [Caenorhabditis briggsae]|uniref:Uncharacterized protein n=1 Tax=Caenorhabditis briggsae TaxID=6238 RepID=A0AAE8ZNF7_CAEBR|nr:hypothetical protein L3Y34_010418 [Caenorhabditis briggsae]
MEEENTDSVGSRLDSVGLGQTSHLSSLPDGSKDRQDSRSGEASLPDESKSQESTRLPSLEASNGGEAMDEDRSTRTESVHLPSIPVADSQTQAAEQIDGNNSGSNGPARLPSLEVSNGTGSVVYRSTRTESPSQALPIAVIVAVPDPTTVKVNSIKNWLASFSASSSIGTTSSSSSPGTSSSPAPSSRRANLRSLPKRSYNEKDDDDDRESGDDEYDVAKDDPQAKKRRKEMEREARKLQKEAEKKEKEFQRNMKRQAEEKRRQDRREEKQRLAEEAEIQKRYEEDLKELEAIKKEQAEKAWRKQKIEDDFHKERQRASKRFSTELKKHAPQEKESRQHRSHSVDWVMLAESSPIDASFKASNNGSYFQLLEETRKIMKRQFANSVDFMERSAKMNNGFYFKSIQDPFFLAAKMRQEETNQRNIFTSFDDELKIRPDDSLLMFPQWNEEEQGKLDTHFGQLPRGGLIKDFGKLLGIEPLSQTVARIGVHTMDKITNSASRARSLEALPIRLPFS